MEIGLFMVPFRAPQTDKYEGFQWDMKLIRWAEDYGLSEVWVAEHSTMEWEPVPSPELYLAAAATMTSRIKLCTGANCPGNHNPMALAHRLMQLDLMSKGRLIVGIGAGAYPLDHKIAGNNDPYGRMIEGLEVMQKIWNHDGPVKFEGKHFSFEIPESDDPLFGSFMKPYQESGIPLAMAGLSPNSKTLTQAGKLGCIPMSFNVGAEYLPGHWYRYVQGTESAGRKADRNEWRIAAPILVADTDEEAIELAVNGALGQTYRECLFPGYERGGMLSIMAPELENVTAKTLSVEYMARNKWYVGSPDTVIKKIQRDAEIAGGFGTIINFTFDYLAQEKQYKRNFELLGSEVIPAIKDIKFKTESLVELARPQGIND